MVLSNVNRVFSTINNKKSNYMHATMFKDLVSNKMPEKVLDLFDQMNIQPDQFVLSTLFSACARLANDRAKETGRKLLDQMPKHFHNDNVLLTSAIYMLMKFGDIENAENLFQMMKKKDIITYGAIMKGYVENKMYDKALDLFEQIPFALQNTSYTIIFNACAQLANDRAKEIGRKLFHQMPKHFHNNNVLLTSAIDMLMKFGDVETAENLFQMMKKKDIITYGAIMKGYVENNMNDKALDLFEQMPLNPNNVIHIIVFNACAELANDRAKEIGRKLLHQMPKYFHNEIVLLTSAIDMLMKFGDVENAENLFQMMKKKDIITYGAMIKRYVKNNMYDKALDLFEQMPLNPNNVIYIIVFNACAQILNDRGEEIGRKLLHQMPKHFHNDNVLLTSAIDMLMRFGDVQSAEKLFRTIKKKDIVLYGAMMNGYNINNEPLKCLQLLEEIKQHGFILDECVSTILINACARLGMISRCQLVIDQIPSYLYNNQCIRNSLIHMWGKAGFVENAQKIFQSIDNPDVVAYNAMIYVYGLNRMGLEAVDLYRKMPHHLRNEVTYVCVLNGCSHSGLLDEAHSIFNESSQKNKQVITTMVDCLSRLYRFDEAQKLIDDYEKSNPPSSVMYMAMLSGARNSHQHILSKKIYDRMNILFPDEKETLKSGSILVGNTYSSVVDYQEAVNIRSKRIRELGTKVKPGVSWTEFNGEILQFKANDRSHPQSEEIHAKAKYISDVLIKYGYNYDSSWITRPLDEDETIESVLCTHSEQLAIAYHFVQQENPKFIQITKNLLTYAFTLLDGVTKLIAKIWQCKIIVRDANVYPSCIPIEEAFNTISTELKREKRSSRFYGI
ncbi:unnamed protein product [Rotaria sordida]|uniref:DYW domain-containing protein n=1 Tax=Rotaria sordida TaxID=392033 RepID=A0A819PTD0_9BILA|nr:unnamed protein product [Rotaria sordida]CAF4016024.1 unnamed protein product [Rotaria sordida]